MCSGYRCAYLIMSATDPVVYGALVGNHYVNQDHTTTFTGILTAHLALQECRARDHIIGKDADFAYGASKLVSETPNFLDQKRIS